MKIPEGLNPGLYLFDGKAAKPLDALTALLDTSALSPAALAQSVTWSYVAISTRRVTIEQFDSEWHVSGKPVDGAPVACDWRDIAGRIDEAVQVYGAAYLHKERNGRGRVIGLRWLAPYTMQIPQDAVTTDGEITYYRRIVNGREIDLPGEDVIRIYRSGMPELFPGTTPAAATEYVLQTLYNLTRTREFLSRNPVHITLIEVPPGTPEAERGKLRAWFSDLLNPKRGNGVEGRVMPITAGVNIHPVGITASELSPEYVESDYRRAVLAAYGVPEEEVLQSANYATAKERHKAFLNRMAGALQRYAHAINSDADMQAQGIEIVPRPDNHPDMQTDEGERAQAMAVYVKAGLTPEAAAYLVGIMRSGFPQEIGEPFAPVAPVQVGAGVEPVAANVTASDDTKADLERWQRKALNAVKRTGKIDSALQFESAHIEPGLNAAIAAQLAECKTAHDVRRVFAFAEYP